MLLLTIHIRRWPTNLSVTKWVNSIEAVPGQLVHKDCRRNYVNPNASANLKEAAPRTPRSITPDFSFKDNCLYCGLHAKFNGKKRGHDVYPVKTIEFKTTFKKMWIKEWRMGCRSTWQTQFCPLRSSCGGCRIPSSVQHKLLNKKADANRKRMTQYREHRDDQRSFSPIG